jgi:putative addiction module killer protein
MISVRTLPRFDAWLARLRDGTTKRRLVLRLRKAQFGKLGEHFGPGWRMYYVQRGSLLIVMLDGGDKASQAADIAEAKRLAATLEEEP